MTITEEAGLVIKKEEEPFLEGIDEDENQKVVKGTITVFVNLNNVRGFSIH